MDMALSTFAPNLFEGRVALVTGGGRGIGRASALTLSHHGWRVVVAGRTQDTLDETVVDLAGDGLAVVTDVADEASVDRWPPMPSDFLLARTTIAIAFQRT